MTKLASFPQFGKLPAELRLCVWEESLHSPGVHLFDVCLPPSNGDDSGRRAFGRPGYNLAGLQTARWAKYKQKAFLDSVEDEQNESGSENSFRTARGRGDPSMYKQRLAQRLTSTEAAYAASLRGTQLNAVFLPGQSRRIEYDNANDVLFLRFNGRELVSRSILKGTSEATGLSAGGITGALESPWSMEMAHTVREARRIAIDVTEICEPSHLVEVAYLASCFQKGLEVFYLVDHTKDGRNSGAGEVIASVEQQQRGQLYCRQNDWSLEYNMTRLPDVLYGVGRTYAEVFDLERLFGDQANPAYLFALRFAEAVRSQQLDAGALLFKGVRVLEEKGHKDLD